MLCHVIQCRACMSIHFFFTTPVTSRLTTLVLFLITLSPPFMCFSVMYFCSYTRKTRQLDLGSYVSISIAAEQRSAALPVFERSHCT